MVDHNGELHITYTNKDGQLRFRKLTKRDMGRVETWLSAQQHYENVVAKMPSNEFLTYLKTYPIAQLNDEEDVPQRRFNYPVK